MAAPASTEEFLDLVRKSGVADDRRLSDYLQKARTNGGLAPDASRMAGFLVRDGILTQFQAEQILQGKWRRFTIGKYKVLEKLGSGGMGAVYLCEHKLMRRRVAVKVLPTAKASDESSLERFYREARAVAALDHPNIVHAYDIDQDEQLHFLVMEYVDGISFHDLVKNYGPLDILRACHYIRQSALGLEHASRAGLVHRDIKPGNILVDRVGTVKILDMGLARFFNDEDDNLTKRFDENVLGTADYLAPEQAVDSHSVDIRADVYSLGATFYYLLTGRTPFGDGTVTQKLLWHQSRQPKPVTEFRKDVPPELAAIILKMMAKEADDRFQTPQELADALEPFTQEPIGPPPDSEMPKLSPAALGVPPLEPGETSLGLKTDTPPRALQGLGSSKSGFGSGPRSGSETASGTSTPRSPAPKSRPPASGSGRPPISPMPTRPPKTPAPQPVAEFTPVNPTPPAEDGPSFWQDMTAEAPQETSTKTATPPPRPASAKKLAPKPATKPQSRNMLWVFGGSFAAVAVVLTAVWFVFLRRAPEPVAPGKTSILEVTADKTKKGAHIFHRVRDAVLKAQKGDTIHVFEDLQENFELDFSVDNRVSELTIQSAPGNRIKWTTAFRGAQDRPLMKIQNGRGLKVKDIVFDGGTGLISLNKLINIEMRCPGLVFENVQLNNFTDSGIVFQNAFGEPGLPLQFKNVEFNGDNALQAASFFAAKGIPLNDYIEFIDCKYAGVKQQFRFSGADRKAVMGDHHLLGITFPPPPPPQKQPDPKKAPDPAKKDQKGPEVKNNPMPSPAKTPEVKKGPDPKKT